MKKPLLCRLGWHTSWFYDCAMIASARCCNKCGDYLDKAAGQRLQHEREMWDKKHCSGSTSSTP